MPVNNSSIPVGTFLAQQGLVNLGQFTGLALGSRLIAQAQGANLSLDGMPSSSPSPPAYGTTAERPVSPLIGEEFFDTTLETPIWWNGAAWVDGVVKQDATGLILVGQLVQDQGSNAGFQYSSLVTNRGAVRTSQYGANVGVPGVVGFKSRGATIGALGAVVAGDVLWRATAIGVTGNGLLIPLAGSIGFEVPAAGVFPGSISPDFVVALAAAITNSRRTTWTFEGLSGDLNMALAGSRLRLKEGANAMQGVATLGVGGTVVVPNTLITASSRIMLSIQDGAPPLGTIYLSARAVGASLTISSTNAADTCTVAWQIWEPAP